ncbi:hypothetical protein SAMN05192574_101722 [Mucilaginibacter gossypiicola]|jgi:hypothetical protein|uniref:Uncharacterized protein n=1 Tax=Mucilaginibacter gossypiicola TaxID=551995 RepID=A0A1H8B1H2_9SPHI|nr:MULTISPECIES: hypothetical protein [Mucilaginibacter]UOE52195.1 hypothetical protein MTO98_14010 [Mucilaginibacter sp. SMC90]SEM75954.1 hypothetical protein SAMN05192574_101722 [Mucilaginibacter gossypiicola]
MKYKNTIRGKFFSVLALTLIYSLVAITHIFLLPLQHQPVFHTKTVKGNSIFKRKQEQVSGILPSNSLVKRLDKSVLEDRKLAHGLPFVLLHKFKAFLIVAQLKQFLTQSPDCFFSALRTRQLFLSLCTIRI